jgi:hypothetical protein
MTAAAPRLDVLLLADERTYVGRGRGWSTRRAMRRRWRSAPPVSTRRIHGHPLNARAVVARFQRQRRDDSTRPPDNGWDQSRRHTPAGQMTIFTSHRRNHRGRPLLVEQRLQQKTFQRNRKADKCTKPDVAVSARYPRAGRETSCDFECPPIYKSSAKNTK